MSEGGASTTVVGDRYELDHRLARGGMADIFLADDRVLERQVVIKMLLPQYAGDPTFVERFRREATSAAKLNHPNVVAVYDWGVHRETCFMAMEYIKGQSLAELLVAHKRLPLRQAIEIASEAAAGLGFAHENGMVHRDIKPGNIMITETGEVKVADFGIVRALDGGDVSLTQTGNVMGTAAYFSPEQARGEIVDPRSDLYALGVVLFEMVTGERPFRASTPLSVAHQHVEELPPVASSVSADVPPAVDAIISTLLTKNPNDRYDSVGELQADLQRVAAGQEPSGALAKASARPPTVAVSNAKLGGAVAADATVAQPLEPSSGPARTEIMSGGPASAGAPAHELAGAGPSAQRRRGGNGAFIMVFAGLLVLAVILLVLLGTMLGDETDVVPDDPAQIPTVADDGGRPDRGNLPPTSADSGEQPADSEPESPSTEAPDSVPASSAPTTAAPGPTSTSPAQTTTVSRASTTATTAQTTATAAPTTAAPTTEAPTPTTETPTTDTPPAVAASVTVEGEGSTPNS